MRYFKATIGPIQFIQMNEEPGSNNHENVPISARQQQRHIQQLLKTSLLQQTGLKDKVFYDTNGKPYLNNGWYLSITHFALTAALALAPFPVGLDGEIPHERLLHVRTKFFRNDEKDYFDFSDILDLTLLWTAKEAVYKLIGQRGISFMRDIHILRSDSGKGQAYVTGHSKIFLQWIETDAIFCLAYYENDFPLPKIHPNPLI